MFSLTAATAEAYSIYTNSEEQMAFIIFEKYALSA
jgi:L-rhamnose mutarotase